MIQRIKTLPKVTWALVVVAFLLGLLLKRGGTSSPAPTPSSTVAHQDTIWTCSMHPQIRMHEPGQCPICFMDLIPLEGGAEELDATELQMSEAALALAEVVTTSVTEGPAQGSILLSGKVAVDETRTGQIAAWTGGRIEKLYVDFTGTRVKAGDPLVELYSPALYAAQEEWLQAVKAAEVANEMQKRSALFMQKAAAEKLKQLGLSDTQIQAIGDRGTASDRVVIPSPLGGVIIHKNAVEGGYVQEGAPIYTVVDLSRLWVLLDVYESDLAVLREGQSVRFIVEALPGETFTGRVDFVDPLLNEKTRTARARVNVQNPDGRLKPGLFVRAEVRFKSPGSVLQVPATAVLRTGKRAVVYVRKPNTESPVFEMREVTLGRRYGDFYEVLSGLAQGEAVVTHGSFKIDSAMEIAAKPSMMHPQEATDSAMPPDKGQGMSMADMSNPASHENAESTFLAALMPVYQDYFRAQTALADDDFQHAREALIHLDQRLAALPMNQVPSGAMAEWHAILHAVHDQVQQAAQWSGIEAARQAFDPISQAMLKMEGAFGHAGGASHFKLFCPMAFDNRGAFWLQNHDTVDNPYFGSAMLRCGSVEATFKSSQEKD